MPTPPLPKPGSTSSNLSLSITNPLVLYRTLLATNRLKPDPAQHRLALHLQKLYFRLKDYRPEIEYRRRLERITRGLASTKPPQSSKHGTEQGPPQPSRYTAPSDEPQPPKPSNFLTTLLAPRATPAMKALQRSTPLHDTALTLDSPQGLLLYGEVGRGKSMLLDLLFNSLPSDRKRRWHFSTFMLDVFRRLEMERLARLQASRQQSLAPMEHEHEHVVLSLARETVETSPVLFLDEFQMPDRASSRLINGFLTGFFGLGGVLVASSNRMPEELSKGVGVKFVDPHYGVGGGGRGKWGRGGWVGSMFGPKDLRKRDENERFVDVLKARCEVWEMEGAKDWRREEIEEMMEGGIEEQQESEDARLLRLASTNDLYSASDIQATASTLETASTDEPATATTSVSTANTTTTTTPIPQHPSDSPPHYHLTTLDPSSLASDVQHLNPSATWSPLSVTIYSRTLTFPQTYFSSSSPASDNGGGVLLSPFLPLLATYLGPADYTSLASRFHSVILTDVPVLTSSMKNEARRFIWLIDALYEAGCRLVISAEAPVDRLFFPEVRRKRGIGGSGRYESDSIESEAMSEMYQDANAPFRPNVASYDGSRAGRGSEEWRSADPTFAPSMNGVSRGKGGVQSYDEVGWRGRERNILADEDADFGPTYGNGRGHGASTSQEGMEEVLRRQGMSERSPGGDAMTDRGASSAGLGTIGMNPDFTDTRVLVGEDEKFAYKRARSRLWEMCGRRWWRLREGKDVTEWWKPEGERGGGQGRFWEGRIGEEESAVVDKVVQELKMEEAQRQDRHEDLERRIDALRDPEHGETAPQGVDGLFKHGASPYRTSEEAPPKFGWQHAWGMVQWGKKAGEWGKGVEGDRRKEKEEQDKTSKS